MGPCSNHLRAGRTGGVGTIADESCDGPQHSQQGPSVTTIRLLVSYTMEAKQMRAVKQKWFIGVLCLFIGYGHAYAQTDSAPPKPEVQASTVEVQPRKLIDATEQYKSSSLELLKLQENEVSKATAKLDELRGLAADGLVAKAEVDSSEQALASLRRQLETTQQQIVNTDQMIAEIHAEQDLAKAQASMTVKTPVKLVSKQYGNFSTTANILRYDGSTAWSISGLGGVQSFFSSAFGHSLPTSAVGQSATHNRLGFDHRNAVDVALHPDSAEGKALIKYLQNQGIPFLAFRGVVPGVATGAHIHIGSPSHRL